jgi:flagellar basal-body rod protein FlgF
MERGLYIAASGMLAEMARQDQLANDLANASTPGYKADRVSQQSFGALLVKDADGSTVGPLGSGAALDKQETDLRPQALRDTGQPLDLAVEGEGYFGVRTAQGVRYTRNGAFTADAKGNLVDQLGNQVLGTGNQPIKVAADGTIDVSKVQLFNVANPVKQGDSNFTGQASGKPTGSVRSGALEGSGVDPARAMIDLMASMRAMEATQRAITTIDSTLQQTATQVGGLPG